MFNPELSPDFTQLPPNLQAEVLQQHQLALATMIVAEERAARAKLEAKPTSLAKLRETVSAELFPDNFSTLPPEEQIAVLQNIIDTAKPVPTPIVGTARFNGKQVPVFDAKPIDRIQLPPVVFAVYTYLEINDDELGAMRDTFKSMLFQKYYNGTARNLYIDPIEGVITVKKKIK